MYESWLHWFLFEQETIYLYLNFFIWNIMDNYILPRK